MGTTMTDDIDPVVEETRALLAERPAPGPPGRRPDHAGGRGEVAGGGRRLAPHGAGLAGRGRTRREHGDPFGPRARRGRGAGRRGFCGGLDEVPTLTHKILAYLASRVRELDSQVFG